MEEFSEQNEDVIETLRLSFDAYDDPPGNPPGNMSTLGNSPNSFAI